MMATLRLWSDEVEAMREDARAAVESGSEFFGARSSVEGLSRDERVAQQRASHDSTMFTAPEAVEQHIAGVRCRVFRPDGPARAVYLHFHGGGMIAGSPEMMDIPNRQLSRAPG